VFCNVAGWPAALMKCCSGTKRPERPLNVHCAGPTSFCFACSTSGGTPLSGAGSGLIAPTPIAPSPASSSSPGAIDGVLLRGLYLFNPRQQEVVVDYFRNLLDSPFFMIDPKKQSDVIKPTIPTNTEWAYPYELRLKLRRPLPMP
jgi:hypothetical protein